MFLAEPPPSQGDIHFRLLGFPVRINPYFWLTTIMLSGMNADPVFVLTWVAAVVLCILAHELGHALVMRAHGYDASIVLYSFGGLAIPRAGRGGLRQVGPVGQILISLAGPAAGFLLAAALAAALHFLGGYHVEFLARSWRDFVPRVDLPNRVLDEFVAQIFYITVWWGVLNLLPVLPLDGGQVAAQVFALLNPQDAMRQALILSVVVGGLMCFVAFFQWHAFFLGVMFIWLTYSNFSALQQFRLW